MYVVNNERNTNCELGYDRTLSIATMTFNGGNGATDDSLSNYKVIRVGDIAFEGHANKVHAYGRFVLNDAGDGLMSPRFSCLRPIVEQRYSFWKYYISREETMRLILVKATKSGTMMNELVADDLMRESILAPCLAEQKVIGDSLSRLDNLITLHQRARSVPLSTSRDKGGASVVWPGALLIYDSFIDLISQNRLFRDGRFRMCRYPRPIPKMLTSSPPLSSGASATSGDTFVCSAFFAGASTGSPSARKNSITSLMRCCRDSLSSP